MGRGESLLDPTLTGKVLERLRAKPEEGELGNLTDQERRILELIAEGHTNRQIAESIFLAEKTVKNYMSNLLAKLGMSRRSEAAAYAARLSERRKREGRDTWAQRRETPHRGTNLPASGGPPSSPTAADRSDHSATGRSGRSVMRAVDVARRRVYAVERSRSVVEVARLMTAEGVHAVVVVDDGRVAGIVTDRDLVTRVLAPGRPAGTPVEEAMTADPVTVDGDEPVEAVQAVLHQHGLRQVPLTCDGRLVGIVALEDLVYELTGELRRRLREAEPLPAGRD